jgi:glycine dehydrogenase subunit 2
MMVEPTETETLETLDRFADEMLRLAALAQTDPQRLMQAPVTTPVCRLDEVARPENPCCAPACPLMKRPDAAGNMNPG